MGSQKLQKEKWGLWKKVYVTNISVNINTWMWNWEPLSKCLHKLPKLVKSLTILFHVTTRMYENTKLHKFLCLEAIKGWDKYLFTINIPWVSASINHGFLIFFPAIINYRKLQTSKNFFFYRGEKAWCWNASWITTTW